MLRYQLDLETGQGRQRREGVPWIIAGQLQLGNSVPALGSLGSHRLVVRSCLGYPCLGYHLPYRKVQGRRDHRTCSRSNALGWDGSDKGITGHRTSRSIDSDHSLLVFVKYFLVVRSPCSLSFVRPGLTWCTYWIQPLRHFQPSTRRMERDRPSTLLPGSLSRHGCLVQHRLSLVSIRLW
jgi:hypothetical protein